MSKKRGASYKRTDPLARFQLAGDQQRDLGIAYRASFVALLRGMGTEQAWCTVTCALNISLMLAEQGFGAGNIPAIKQAQAAMLRAQERASRTGKWALDGDGIRALQAALEIHDEQLSRATRGQVKEALAEVHRRIESGDVFIQEALCTSSTN